MVEVSVRRETDYRSDLRWRMSFYWLAVLIVFGAAIATGGKGEAGQVAIFVALILLLSNVFTERCLNCGYYVWRGKPGSEAWRGIFRWPSICWQCGSHDFVNAPAAEADNG